MDVQDSPISDVKAGRTYWLYSRRGPGDRSRCTPYTLRDGYIPTPVVGEVARGLVAHGLRALDADKCSIKGWPDKEPVGGWRPVLGPPHGEAEKVVEYKVVERVVPAEMVDGLPTLRDVDKLPAVLPVAYQRLFACYTKAGALKAKHDWE